MNILFITAELPFPSNSGARIYTWERIKQLAKYNEINLISLRENNEKVEKAEILKYCRKFKVFERKKDYIYILRNIVKPYSMISRYNNNIYNYIKEEEHKYDLIILDSLHMILNIPHDVKTKVLLTQHNIEWRAFKSISDNSKNLIKKNIFLIESLKLKIYEKKVYRGKKISGYTFISEEDKNELEKTFRLPNTILINSGMNLNLLELNKKKYILSKNKEYFNIVFSGKMNYEPNVQAVEWFISEIWEDIKNKIPNVKFYIVGRDPVESIVNINDPNIIITGEVESVLPYLENATLVVIPLLSGGGVKIKLIEALSTANVVVTTKKGSEGTKFKDKIHLLIANDSKEFSKKCIDVINDIDSYNQIVLEAQELLKREYCWEKIGIKYQQFIENL